MAEDSCKKTEIIQFAFRDFWVVSAKVTFRVKEYVPMISESRESGTATSVDHTSEPFSLSASMLHNASFRADQRVCCSCRSRANSNFPAWWHFAISFTTLIFSWTCDMSRFSNMTYIDGPYIPLPWSLRTCKKVSIVEKHGLPKTLHT